MAKEIVFLPLRFDTMTRSRLQHVDTLNAESLPYAAANAILHIYRSSACNTSRHAVSNTSFKGYQTSLTQYMPKKRASRGRSKGGKGSSGTVSCSQCGALVPRDKAKKVTGRITLVEPTLAKELRASGAYIPMSTDVKFYCVSCAVHRGIVKVRSESDRRTASKLR